MSGSEIYDIGEKMYEKVSAYIKENEMILPGDLVLAGVSGGGDSMAMLHMLKRFSEETGFLLEAVHVHHGIRGKEADRDLNVVEKFCKDIHISFRPYYYDVPKLAGEWKLGLEETGRVVRRMAFRDAVSEAEKRVSSGSSLRVKTALAHNKNDLAETMLHNLARGTGLRGLAGIRPVNGGIIRPVLCLERREIDNYLYKNEIPYVTDSSNLEDDYTRNRIRHHVLPVMEQEINDKAVSHMAEAAGLMEQADIFLTKCAGKLAEQSRKENGSYLLEPDFFREDRILQSYAVMEILENLAGRRKDISVVHVQQTLALMQKQNGRRVSLPYGLCAVREYGGIRICPEEKSADIAGPGEAWPLLVPGMQKCPLGNFYAEIFPYFGQKISEKKYTKWLDYDKIKKNLSIRTRRPGDYLFIGADGCRKKISRCMIDDKIPPGERNRIPLLACDAEVLWVVGGRISEKYKITPDTERVLEVRYQGGYEDE